MSESLQWFEMFHKQLLLAFFTFLPSLVIIVLYILYPVITRHGHHVQMHKSMWTPRP